MCMYLYIAIHIYMMSKIDVDINIDIRYNLFSSFFPETWYPFSSIQGNIFCVYASFCFI